MTRAEMIAKVHEQIQELLEGMLERMPDAKISPMSSRLLFRDATDLLGKVAVLVAVLNLDEGSNGSHEGA